MKKICLAGYSGHGFVVAEIVMLLQHQLVGYIDLKEKNFNPFKLIYIGNENKIDLTQFIKDNIHVALGLGDNTTRKNLYSILKKANISVETLQHPHASVSNLSSVDEGTIIMSSAIINPFVKIGKASICNSGCIIEHECVIEDYVHVAPGAVLAGNVTVGEGSFIGANAFIKQGIRIGSNVTVGAGSVVLKNVADNVLIYGNPAKTKNA